MIAKNWWRRRMGIGAQAGMPVLLNGNGERSRPEASGTKGDGKGVGGTNGKARVSIR